jgi:hypothetical protein
MTMFVLINNTPAASTSGTSVTVTDTATVRLNLANGAITANVQPASIDNSMVAASAAIARSKVAAGTANRIVYNLTGTGALADAAAITPARALISDAAGIPAHSTTTAAELGFVGGVTSSVQTQLNSKLTTGTGALVNADVSGSAAIARSKIATGTANRIVYNLTGTGALTDAPAITPASALISDAAGIPTHSPTTAAELGFVSGVTSSIQTQLTNNKNFSVMMSSGVINLTNQAAAVGIIGTTAVTKVNLTNYTQIRLCALKANLAGAAGSILGIRYITAYSTTAASYLAISSPVCEVSLAGSSVFLDSGYLNLVAGAKADVFIALVAEGGDGVADPNFGNVVVYFR